MRNNPRNRGEDCTGHTLEFRLVALGKGHQSGRWSHPITSTQHLQRSQLVVSNTSSPSTNLKAMASANLSKAERWRAAIDMNGFISLDDPAVGLRAEEFANKRWPRTSLDGLRFLKEHTSDDNRILEIYASALYGSKVETYILGCTPGYNSLTDAIA